MKTKTFFYFCALLPLLSCSQEEVLEVEKPAITIDANKITPEQAIKNANSYFVGLSHVPTKSGNRIVEDIKAIGSKSISTRASEDPVDTLLYVINYANDEGFIVMGADKRALPVYGISDSGKFVVDVNSPAPLKATLNNAKLDALQRISGVNNIQGTPPWVGFRGWDQDIEYKIKPMIGFYQSRLSNPAMDKYIKMHYGDEAKALCVPLALESFMSFYMWPESVDDRKLNWQMMNSGNGDDDMAYLLYVLGLKENLNETYIGEYKGSSHRDIPRTLRNMGYNCGDEFISFYDNEDKINEELHQSPIIMQAYSSYYPSGHVWLIDGLVRYKVVLSFISPIDPNNPRRITNFYNLYHCVWGYHGNCNGYYFQKFVGTPEFTDPIDNGSEEDMQYVYCDKDVKCLIGARPNK